MNRRYRLWALGAGFALAATAALPGTAAQAADDPSFTGSYAPVTMGGDGSPGRVTFLNLSEHAVVNPTVTIDTSGLAGVASLLPVAHCTTKGTTTTCPLPPGADFAGQIPLTLKAVSGAHAGAHGTIAFTLAGDNVTSQSLSDTVTLADGVDLVVKQETTKVTAKVGGTATLTADIYNVGNKVAQGVRFYFAFDHGLVPDPNLDQCMYAEDTVRHQHVVRCEVPELILGPDALPGATIDVDSTVAPDAGKTESVDMYIDAMGARDVLPPNLTFTSHPKTGHKLVVKTAKKRSGVPADLNSYDNNGYLDVSVAGSHTNVAALGATASGTVGQTVPVTIGVRNQGPAALDGTRSLMPPVAFYFTVPSGTTVVGAPKSCGATSSLPGGSAPKWGAAGGDYYLCYIPTLFLGAVESSTVTFQLKITKVISNDAGSVSLDSKISNPAVYQDDNPKDNTAAVIINPASGGSGGGLPITGAPTTLLVAGGATVLVVGAVLVLLGRRRNAQH